MKIEIIAAGALAQVFVHASNILRLDQQAVEKIIEWQPDIVLSDGPPLSLDCLSHSALQ